MTAIVNGIVSSAAALQVDQFNWTPQPAAQRLISSWVDAFTSSLPEAGRLAQRMKIETGTRFIDWIDTIVHPESDDAIAKLREAGFVESKTAPDAGDAKERAIAFRHPGGMFPRVRVGGDHVQVALKVESIVDFAGANDLPLLTADDALQPFRRLLVVKKKGAALWAYERHGHDGASRTDASVAWRLVAQKHLERFRTRRRDFVEDASGFDLAFRLIDEAIGELGVDWTCDLWFAAEREFWQRRNRAAQVQKARQDRLGLGWANHDHHTYRSSRRTFTSLVAMWEKLGFFCRERFYAGREAGWGAQVMEQPVTGIITFNDVDLSPEELAADFAHEPMQTRKTLGTVGLWCGLHGESFLQAGMHHLEAMFDFEALREQLASESVKTMKPFTDFPHLRQAFTEGERWRVRPERLTALVNAKLITPEQAEKFANEGAIGSHLENLERNDGFKGFNQTGVSEIIAATDPRKQK